jgi:hypothetical protein
LLREKAFVLRYTYIAYFVLNTLQNRLLIIIFKQNAAFCTTLYSLNQQNVKKYILLFSSFQGTASQKISLLVELHSKHGVIHELNFALCLLQEMSLVPADYGKNRSKIMI